MYLLRSRGDTLSDVCGVVSHVLDSCHRMESMGMLYFLYLSRGNLWQGPSFVPSFQDGYWYVLGVRLNKHNTFVWYPQTVSLSPWWAGNTVWGFQEQLFLTCTSVICLVLKAVLLELLIVWISICFIVPEKSVSWPVEHHSKGKSWQIDLWHICVGVSLTFQVQNISIMDIMRAPIIRWMPNTCWKWLSQESRGGKKF